MPDGFVTWATFLAVALLAIAMVQAATRASTRDGVLREALRGFVALAGGFALLIACVELVLLVVQSQHG